MKKYKHLKLEDRLIIEALIKLRKTCKEMSIELNRSESTIRREVKKIDTRHSQVYSITTALEHAHVVFLSLTFAITALNTIGKKYINIFTVQNVLRKLITQIYHFLV